jgi:hypothetical protein
MDRKARYRQNSKRAPNESHKFIVAREFAELGEFWIPASAGMTNMKSGVTT